MNGMLSHLLLLPAVFVILIACSDVCKGYLQCLAWDIYQERLKFICRIPGFSHPVSLIDSQGQLYVQCTFNRNVSNCTPAMRNDSVVTHFALNYITVTTGVLNKEMNGLWSCLQNNTRLTTYVNLSKGIRDSTEVNITGYFRNEKENLRSIIRCSSCREPDGHNVEFLENNRSVDSLTFSYDTGICTHKHGNCTPNACSCTGIDFILAFQYDTKSNGSVYSCDVMYTDSSTQEKFSIHASTFFNGKEFYMTNTYSKIIKAGDKIWNEQFTTIDITSDMEVDPAGTTPVADADTISVGSIGGFQTIHVIAIVIGCVMVFIVANLLCNLYFKRKASSNRTTHEIAGIEERIELEPLMKTGNKSSIETQTSTGDTRITSSTMTETSYLLQEKSVFKLNASSYVTDLYFCDPCSYQSKDRLSLFFCIDCEEALCAICLQYHNVMKQTRTHNCVSMNKVPRNFSLPLTCTDHDPLKYEYYCVDHVCFCCVRCIVTCHAGKGCKPEPIDDSSNGFQKTQVFFDYDRQLNKYIDLLVKLNTNQYNMIDQMTNIIPNNFGKKFFDENEMDCETVKLELNAYAKETCDILISTREQKELFEFMKTYGSDKHLFILTHFLKQSLIEIDQRVSELVGHTRHACTCKTKSQENHVATCPTIEMIETELENISFHRWRQSQTPVKETRLT